MEGVEINDLVKNWKSRFYAMVHLSRDYGKYINNFFRSGVYRWISKLNLELAYSKRFFLCEYMLQELVPIHISLNLF